MNLYPFQKEALNHFSRQEVHLALTAPTGSGKGVILEALAQDPEERILVLTPLVALARQQRLRFLEKGVPGERVRVLSPESALFRAREIRQWRPSLIAVDEAHCLPEWGTRFRPAYGKLLEFIRNLRCPRTLWMSATFPRELLKELKSNLPGPWSTLGKFRIPNQLRSTFLRISPSDRLERIREQIIGREDPGLLFVSTRKDVERYASLFAGERSVLPYHAGLSDEERRLVETTLTREARFAKPRTSVVATNAFGMGMDFPQFGWALLSHAPFSLLSLMQSFGRVARGERHGEAELYWAEEDFRFAGLLLGATDKRAQRNLAVLRRYLEGSDGDRAQIESVEFL